MAITTASQSQLGQDTAKNSQVVTTAVKLINSGASTGPLITSIIVTDSGYNNLDDTAVGTSNSFIKIIGSGFANGANVFVAGTQVPAANVTFTSSSEIRVRLPVLTSGTNNAVSLFNSSGSGVIYASNLFASGFPTVTTSSYSVESFTVSTQLLATGDGTLSYSLKSGSSLPSGLTLSSTGLISGTVIQNSTTIFTILVDDSQGQTSQQDITLVINGLDPYYQYTSLLLQADNTSNNSHNGAFVDSSINGYSMVPTANVTQGTVNPFGTGTWSNYFDGTTDYLTTPDTSAFGYSTGDFTIEFWMYLNSIASDVTILSNLSSGPGVQPHIYFGQSGSVIKYYTNGGDRITSSAISALTWYHVVICRSSGSTKMFINGTQAGSTYTDANNYGSSAPLGIGTYWNAGSPVTISNFNGYISNVRILKGTALYTTTFTPSTTPLTAVANTVLLTCQSNNFKDSSNSALTLTAAGNSGVERFNPFGVNQIGYEVSANTFAGSTYFNGSSDYLTIGADTGLNLSADFTVETWAYATTTTNAADQVFNYGNFTFMLYHIGTTWTVEIGSGSSNYFSLQGTASLNNWHHFAITRNANTYTFWINGVSAATSTNSNPPALSGATLNIGRSRGTSNQWFTGFISNFRILKGTALYTSDFTPSTLPLTAVANTQLLTCQTSQSVVTDESTNKFTITSVGTPKATTKTPFTLSDTSTANTTYSGSYYFNGSLQYLQTPMTPALKLGANNFTIECWAYINAYGSQGVVFGGPWQTPSPSFNNGAWVLGVVTGATSNLIFNSSTTGTDTISLTAPITISKNTWNHFAVVRNGNNLSSYFNGNLVTSNTNYTMTINNSSTQNTYIGYNPANGVSPGFLDMNGYISNFRVVNGTAVYTSAFTPPTTPLQPIANTVLLLTGENSGIYDAALKNSIQTIGDTKVRTNVTKYGTGSMYFEGTADYLSIPHTKDIDLSSGDFTIEIWVQWISYVAGSAILFKGGAAPYGSYLIYVGDASNGTEVDFYTSISGSAWSVSGLNFTINPTLGVWHHLAVTRSGNVYRTFFNGTLANSVTQAGNLISQPTTPLWLGKYNAGSTFYGYMDDLRITKGYARYTANFTPPDAALKNK
jgi:hypothetical protein